MPSANGNDQGSALRRMPRSVPSVRRPWSTRPAQLRAAPIPRAASSANPEQEAMAVFSVRPTLRRPAASIVAPASVAAPCLFVSDVVAQPAAGQKPTNLTATQVPGGVQLNWDAPQADSEEISGYQILRRRTDRGERAVSSPGPRHGLGRDQLSGHDGDCRRAQLSLPGQGPARRVPRGRLAQRLVQQSPPDRHRPGTRART